MNYKNFSAKIYPLLKPYIKSIEIETTIAPKKIIPEPYVNIGFQCIGNLTMVLNNGKLLKLKQNGITGLLNNYRIFQPENDQVKSILIKIYPWSVGLFLKESAHNFSHESLALDGILANQLVDRLINQLHDTQDHLKLTQIIQDFFLHLYLKNVDKYLAPGAIVAVAKDILTNSKKEPIEKLARHYGLSKRTLERQFKTYIGVSPQTFFLLNRFHYVLNSLRAGNTWENILEKTNYYDQAHFINEFRRFSGISPGKIEWL